LRYAVPLFLSRGSFRLSGMTVYYLQLPFSSSQKSRFIKDSEEQHYNHTLKKEVVDRLENDTKLQGVTTMTIALFKFMFQ
jgi:protein involved in sex pheromone biosynthesis